MAIYPDKKAGQLTGRWRVELQQGTQRYRKRHDLHADAVADEEFVRSSWARGEPVGAIRPDKAPTLHSIASVTQEARGTLWGGKVNENSAWAHIRVIGEIIGAETPLDSLATAHLTTVIKELSSRGKTDATINRYLSHFRSFLVWAYDEGFKTTHIGDIKFRWKKETAGRIRWITPDEELQLKKFLPANVWMLVKVAIETGCRRNELLTLEPRDINGNRMHLWDTKTDYPRTVPMSEETTQMINTLLAKGTMPTQRGLRSWWQRAKVKMGLEHDDQFVFHVCRHTCATRLVDAGVNLLVIKEWLGHKRIETTQRYAHVNPSNLDEALLRRGTMSTMQAQEAQKTAVSRASPPSPTRGVMGVELAQIGA